jgi:hypothetical protein
MPTASLAAEPPRLRDAEERGAVVRHRPRRERPRPPRVLGRGPHGADRVCATAEPDLR